MFTERVAIEIERARRKHGKMNSLHEGYAVLLEEVDEFWEHVKHDNQDKAEILSELVQIGAMAQRIAEDLSLDERL